MLLDKRTYLGTSLSKALTIERKGRVQVPGRASPASTAATVQNASLSPGTRTSITLTLGATPKPWNVLVAGIAYSQFNAARTIDTPSGWTKLLDKTSGNDSLAIYYHVVQAGDGTGTTWNVSGASSENVAGVMWEVQGVPPDDPIDGFIWSDQGALASTLWVSVCDPPGLAFIWANRDSNTSAFNTLTGSWTAVYPGDGSGFHRIIGGVATSVSQAKAALEATTASQWNIYMGMVLKSFS